MASLDVNVKTIDVSCVVDPSVTPVVVDAIVIVGRIPSITRAEPFTNELPPEPIGSGSVKVASFPAISLIVPPFNVNGIAQLAAVESLKDKKFVIKSTKHNSFFVSGIKKFLEKYKIYSNPVSANFLLLNFEKCKYSAKYLYNKLKKRGIILRSTEDGYHIKNKLRLTIGSKKENLIFMNTIKQIFKK